MDYKANKCINCGCANIEIISQTNVQDNVFYTYRCTACGEEFSTETSYLKKQEKLNRQKEKLNVAKQQNSNIKMDFSAIEIFNNNRKFVVEIEADFNDKIGNGTGFIIGNGYILSNAHVVFDKQEDYAYPAVNIVCKLENNSIILLDLIYADINRDIALLYSEELDINGAIMCHNPVETGESIYAIGNSKGQGICILDGIISDKKRIINNEEYIMYTAPTVCGNSGGPLLNKHGEIVGMVTLGQKDGSLMNYAIPVCEIEKFINVAKVKENINL